MSLITVLEKTDLDESSILLICDHGNLEDLTTPRHTHNPVPALLWGPLKEYAGEIHSLLDVAPLILKNV